VIVLKGEGGVGKSHMASMAVREDTVRRHFADGGILWVNARLEGADPVASVVRAIASDLHCRLLSPRFGTREPPPAGGGDVAVSWISARVRGDFCSCVLLSAPECSLSVPECS
jgi:hypothetical protein